MSIYQLLLSRCGRGRLRHYEYHYGLGLLATVYPGPPYLRVCVFANLLGIAIYANAVPRIRVFAYLLEIVVYANTVPLVNIRKHVHKCTYLPILTNGTVFAYMANPSKYANTQIRGPYLHIWRFLANMQIRKYANTEAPSSFQKTYIRCFIRLDPFRLNAITLGD